MVYSIAGVSKPCKELTVWSFRGKVTLEIAWVAYVPYMYKFSRDVNFAIFVVKLSSTNFILKILLAELFGFRRKYTHDMDSRLH